MNLLVLIRVLIVLGIGMMFACGNTSTDDRTVLSSQSVDYLIIPDGASQGAVISKTKLANAIAEQFNSISKVRDLSMEEKLFATETLLTIATLGMNFLADADDWFLVSFTIETQDGAVYNRVNCVGASTLTTTPVEEIVASTEKPSVRGVFHLFKCENDEIKLSKELDINLSDILL